jgi:putative serine protease PepD
MKRLVPVALLAALLGATLTGGFVLLSAGSPNTRTTTVQTPAGASATGSSSAGSRREVSSSSGSAPLSATAIYRMDSSGVVAIRAAGTAGEDSGTGIVLDESGLILTNNHVVAEAQRISVAPGKSPSDTRSATLVGADPNDDLALLKVDPTGLGLKPLKFANSAAVEVGDSVYAIGNPYGLDETLTKGIVSALDREIQAPDGAAITGAIQTDAALNPGNSGGPLLNAAGEAIGVNSQIASDAARTEDSQPGSTGVGFAISANTAAQAVKAIESGATGTTASGSAGTSRGGTVVAPTQATSPYGEAGAGPSEEAGTGPEAGAGASEGGTRQSETGTRQGEAGTGEGEGASGESGGPVVIVP